MGHGRALGSQQAVDPTWVRCGRLVGRRRRAVFDRDIRSRH